MKLQVFALDQSTKAETHHFIRMKVQVQIYCPVIKSRKKCVLTHKLFSAIKINRVDSFIAITFYE